MTDLSRTLLMAAALSGTLAACGETAPTPPAEQPQGLEPAADSPLQVTRTDEAMLAYRTAVTVPNGCFRLLPAQQDDLSRDGDMLVIRRQIVLEQGVCTQALRNLTVDGSIPYRASDMGLRLEITQPGARPTLRYSTGLN